MKTGLQLSLNLGSFVGEDLINLTDRCIKFEPYIFLHGSKTQAWDAKKHRKAMQKFDGKGSLGFNDLLGNVIFIGIANKRHSFITISIVQERELFPVPVEEIIQSASLMPGFISGYIYDNDYVSVQSEEFSNNLTAVNLSPDVLNSIRNTPFKAGVHGKEYDVKYNPGRKILMDYSWILAAWKMWFGSGFFILAPKERILSFPNAVEIRESTPGIVYVQLFEGLETSYSPESMFRQWKWQEWLDFDGLIRNQDSW